MQPISHYQQTNSFIDPKIFQGTNTCDDFLVGSDLLSKSTKQVYRVEDYQNQISFLQNQRVMMRNIVEEQIFKLKQNYETLKGSFKEFTREIMGLITQAQIEISNKLTLSMHQNELQRTMKDMNDKVSSIQKFNTILKQQNQKMLGEIEYLKATINQNGKIQSRYMIQKELREKEEIKMKSQLADKQREKQKQKMLRYKEYKEEVAIKSRRSDSRDSYRTLTNPQPYLNSPYNNFRLVNERNTTASPMSLRQRKSELDEDQVQQKNRYFKDEYKNGSSFSFTRKVQESIPQEEYRKVITRKPGIPTGPYKSHRYQINLSQIQTRLNTIKQQLRNEIRSVQKKRI